MVIRRRGRPPKFGRPGQSLTLTLPGDVVEWLLTLHDDPAWAIVGLHERRGTLKRPSRSVKAAAELVQLPGRRALILVRPEALRSVAGVSVVPLSDGRAFIALDAGSSAADLEVAVLDRLDAPGVSGEERAQLIEFCQYALARGAEMWAHIPAFAERRMGVGVPLSMVPLQKYEEGSRRVQWTGHPDLLPVVFHNDAMSVYEVRHRPS